MISPPVNITFVMKITERQLAQLAAVVQSGSVTEGAALLGLSQPALSRTISELEKRLGEPLFKPGKRPLEPTSLGLQLGTQGKVILAATDKASRTIDGFRSGTTGLVRVGGVPFFMDALVSSMLAEFRQDYPDIRVDLSYGYLPQLQAALQADQIDLAIAPMGVADAEQNFDYQEILPARNVVACRVGHPLMRKRNLTEADLVAYPWIEPPAGSPLMGDMHAVLLSFGLRQARIAFSGGSLMSVLNYLFGTDALTVLPHSVVFAFRKENRITVLPVQIPQGQRSLGIIRNAEAASPPAADRFAAHIKDQFEALTHLILRHENAVVWGR